MSAEGKFGDAGELALREIYLRGDRFMHAALWFHMLLALSMGGDPITLSELFRPAAPFAPYDCTSFTGGEIADLELPIER